MRGRPEPVEDVLPDIWQVVEELKRLTEGLEKSLARARAAKKGDTSGSDD